MTQTFYHPERGCVPQGAAEMTQTDTSIRRLAEKAAWCGNSVYHDEYPQGKWDARCCYCKRMADVIESALTTLATQIREEDAQVLIWAERQLRALVTDDDGNGAFIRGTGVEMAGFGVGMEKLRATIRARQEK